MRYLKQEITNYKIKLDYDSYVVEFFRFRVVNAPPVVRWMIGKPIATIKSWVESKAGTMEKLN